MDTRLTLLGLLGTGPGHGYDLKTSWDRWFAQTKPLAFGQVYASLARLLRDGLIELAGAEPGAGPERKRYAITPQGRAAVEEWITTPEVPSDSIQADLFAKTVIALLLDDDAEHLLDLQRTTHTARMREITRRKDGADLRTTLLADHALYHLEADLRWIDLTAARLAELRTEVLA
ncbi:MULTISPECIES: PadR family transcriptional regulator [unclassified Actinomyces]|uniref:PadR family transcriptional regulator n=1 Tax=unclassified Actinomyces TaxID=2609248 RepID=UPI0020172637|nr:MULTISPECIES: PadR family transcriptional regulator [unclassified Actinomyces]MCL3778397.1 PadR family transcriptional regulator [Actinomyces sp. AC-20-1]MCL3790068.1 PadR family transcriptional regulator [Actinomyces sp. 187325]MCL3792331.1 PadR family transcriptional regulator [Actinomyces sp. 186855]MCL3794909.1 PadR family transcriptional regulator [Actinomyces sp. 217892]